MMGYGGFGSGALIQMVDFGALILCLCGVVDRLLR